MGFRRPGSCIAARLDAAFRGFKENEVNFLTGRMEGEKRWTELQNYKIKGADWYAGARFVDLVLALGIVDAPRGDLGPTASSS
jgi:hypothetical protein